MPFPTPTPWPRRTRPRPADVYTAAQQQLGLKIDPTRLRIDVLVLDQVEKPSAN